MKKMLLLFCLVIVGAISIGLPVFTAEAPPETVQLINPIGGTAGNPEGTTDLNEIVGVAIKQITGILGSIALVVFVYGGFMWLTSAGSADKVKKGMDAMVWAAIGIVIIFSSYAILTLVFKALNG